MNKSVHDTLYNKRRCEERTMGSQARASVPSHDNTALIFIRISLDSPCKFQFARSPALLHNLKLILANVRVEHDCR